MHTRDQLLQVLELMFPEGIPRGDYGKTVDLVLALVGNPVQPDSKPEPVVRKDLSPNDQKMIDLLRKSPLTTSELASKLGEDEDHIRTRFYRLKQRGFEFTEEKIPGKKSKAGRPFVRRKLVREP